MDKLRKTLVYYIYEFVSPVEIAQLAKTSSVQWNLFKSKIDLDLIHFYKKFEIVRSLNIERHLCVLITSGKEIFNNNKFDYTTQHYLFCFAKRHKIFFRENLIFENLICFFENLPQKIQKFPRRIIRFIFIKNLSRKKVYEKVKEALQYYDYNCLYIEGTEYCYHKVKQEVWDILKNQNFEIVFQFAHANKGTRINIKDKILSFYVMDSYDCRNLSRFKKFGGFDDFDLIQTYICGYSDYWPSLIKFLKITKTDSLVFYDTNNLYKLNLRNLVVRELEFNNETLSNLYNLIGNNKGVTVYIKLGFKEDFENCIKFKSKNQINSIYSTHHLLIHSLYYNDKYYYFNIKVKYRPE